ncbi:hypothetical protein QUF54_09330, partial [Candidatus Marithioploca araucensis]|nr:hypothetical protein [Candidatus Marithioploca araucensis]
MNHCSLRSFDTGIPKRSLGTRNPCRYVLKSARLCNPCRYVLKSARLYNPCRYVLKSARLYNPCR